MINEHRPMHIWDIDPDLYRWHSAFDGMKAGDG